MALPVATIKGARRRALGRRYGYAALRVLRRGLRLAVERHAAAQFAQQPYSVMRENIVGEYHASVKALRRRWPDLDFGDPRAEP